jgi:hypothetical protein
MARERWTDERLDDLAGAMRGGFDRVDRSFERVDRRFEQVDRRFEQVDRNFERVQEDIRELRQTMLRGGAALIATQMIGFLGVLAAILARGA